MKKIAIKKDNQFGSALVTLLLFVAMVITISGAAVSIGIINAQSASRISLSDRVFQTAETGVEIAVIKILRDPNYSGEVLNMDGITATISVTGSTTKTITVQASLNGYVRKVQALGSFSGGAFSLSSWEEID